MTSAGRCGFPTLVIEAESLWARLREPAVAQGSSQVGSSPPCASRAVTIARDVVRAGTGAVAAMHEQPIRPCTAAFTSAHS